MMEKFFIVTDKSNLFKDYFDYRNSIKIVNKAYGEFSDIHNIKANQYIPLSDRLYIDPTEEDKKNFESQFSKSKLHESLYCFKKTSVIGKAWVEFIKGTKIFHKPHIGFYFREVYGRYTYRLFDIDNVLYCSVEYDGKIDTPEGFDEIKGSEFHKIIEDHNNAMAEGGK